MTLSLEVQVPPTGLPNLVPNPNGDNGAWGYITPVNATNLTTHTISGASWLDFIRSSGVSGAYLTTEFLPVASGWVAGRFDIVAPAATPGTPAAVTAYLDFYDSARALISSSPGYGPFSAVGTVYVSGIAIPTGATSVKLRLAVAGTGAIYLSFRQVMVTWAPTSAGLGTTRSNLISNGGFESNLVGWVTTSRYPTAASRSVATAHSGGASMWVTQNNPTGAVVVAEFAVTPNMPYTASFWHRADLADFPPGTLPPVGEIVIKWVNAAGQVVGLHRDTYNGSLSFAWQRLSTTATSVRTAVLGQLEVTWRGGQTRKFFVDDVLVEQGAVLRDYYAGAYSSGASFDYAAPRGWQDVLGGTHSITIERSPLDVGGLNVTILDPALDPATAELLRQGRAIRLLDDQNGPLYTGKILQARTTYGSAVADRGTVRIELSAIDANAALAQQAEPRGVATVAELAGLLEGKGVPWCLNGSVDQYPYVPAPVAINESASTIDQIAVTRDTALAAAWVDRRGVLNVWDRAELPGLVNSFSDQPGEDDSLSYSAIGVGFDPDSCINEVLVTWLRYDPATQSSEEITYGPYRDELSILEWDVHSRTFTIQGPSEDPAEIKAYAEAILAANGQPRVKCNQLTMPVRTPAEVQAATVLDLYDLVSVEYADRVDEDLRIARISHSITAVIEAGQVVTRWSVTYGFADDGAVATPQQIPAPGNNGALVGGPVPVGGRISWEGPTDKVPSGWLLCDGTSYPVATYPGLFSVIGYTHGGSGGFFNVPSHVDRFTIGAGVKALGTTGGGSTHTHALSDDGYAQIAVGETTVFGRRITPAGASYDESFRVGGSDETEGTARTLHTPLRGATDAATSLPPWRASYQIIKA